MIVAVGADPTIVDFASYGALGLVLVAVLLGWLWPKPAVDKLVKSETAATARADALADVLKDEILPALRDVAKATGAGGPLEKIADKVDTIDRRLDTFSRSGGGSSS